MSDAAAGPDEPTASEPTLVVTGGGPVSHEELAALVVALSPVRVEAGAEEPRVRGWKRAALLEGTGRRTSISHADLTARAPWE